MDQMTWWSIAIYLFVFNVFLFFQDRHYRSFKGEAQGVAALLAIYVLLGLLIKLAYLITLGIVVLWWVPLIVLALALIVSPVVALVPLPDWAMSLLGLPAIPIAAVAMFVMIL